MDSSGRRDALAAIIVADKWHRWVDRASEMQRIAQKSGLHSQALLGIALIEDWARPVWFRAMEYVVWFFLRILDCKRASQMTLGPMQVKWSTLRAHGVAARHSWRDAAQLVAGLTRTCSDRSVYGIGVRHGGNARYGTVLDDICRLLTALNNERI